ncbi:hypothetical protein IWX46DRAFT_595536 [Phyllosticta citricarpa]|uniref:Uncharacterized protein n=1 Tax=Phyllosticta citricarpa TaxID=55181 RepID=A0ABR1MIY8_9PEZI
MLAARGIRIKKTSSSVNRICLLDPLSLFPLFFSFLLTLCRCFSVLFVLVFSRRTFSALDRNSQLARPACWPAMWLAGLHPPARPSSHRHPYMP